MKRLLALCLVAAAVVLLPSCRRAVERSARKIRIVEVGRPEMQGLTAFSLPLRIDNGSAHVLRLSSASLMLRCGDDRVAEVRLREEAEVPRRAAVDLTTRWRLRIVDPLALYVVAGRLREGDLSALTVDYAVAGRGGPAAVNISRERVPLSEFLNTFGLTSHDVAQYFRIEP